MQFFEIHLLHHKTSNSHSQGVDLEEYLVRRSTKEDERRTMYCTNVNPVCDPIIAKASAALSVVM
jgi:hypothetical protein